MNRSWTVPVPRICRAVCRGARPTGVSARTVTRNSSYGSRRLVGLSPCRNLPGTVRTEFERGMDIIFYCKVDQSEFDVRALRCVGTAGHDGSNNMVSMERHGGATAKGMFFDGKKFAMLSMVFGWRWEVLWLSSGRSALQSGIFCVRYLFDVVCRNLFGCMCRVASGLARLVRLGC